MHSPSPSTTTRGVRFAALCGAAIAVASLAGCRGGILPSARLVPPMSLGPAPADVAVPGDPLPTSDASCLVPPAGYCGADGCPPLITCRGSRILHGLGPLFYREDEEGQLTEAELYPPHSRFHPVPTAPVFAQRTEYEPPELIMEPVPAKPHLAPRTLPNVPQDRLRSPLPTDGKLPAMVPVPTDPWATNAAPERIPAEPPNEEGYDAKATREPHSVLLLKG